MSCTEPTDSPTAPSLCPAQRAAYDQVLAALAAFDIVELRAANGRGRSTVLRCLQRELGGTLLTVREFLDAVSVGHPLALDEAVAAVVLQALRNHEVVLVDDLHLQVAAMSECHFYPRQGLLAAAMEVVGAFAAETRRKLILGTERRPPPGLGRRCQTVTLAEFESADYRHLCERFFRRSDPETGDPETGDRETGTAPALDYGKIHRFAPKLDAHQLERACHWCRSMDPLDTGGFIEYLRTQQLASNVHLGEVADVDLGSLKGVDQVLESLETHVIHPLENDSLAEELQLRPKRGVLLVGPPGTGKTTVGRALAHRLRGKFFLLDGTIISGTEHFYALVHHVFKEAQENAPSVIFIDDSDVIFESGQEHGLYRYLLTMLDGLESKSAARVCVMLTAMDVGNLPPALVRSGRIELWLEMQLPDRQAREAILRDLLAGLPAEIGAADAAEVARQTEGFSGADLKRVVEESKAVFALDRSRGAALRPATDYLTGAATGVAASREKYAEAEARIAATRPARPPWFAVASRIIVPDRTP